MRSEHPSTSVCPDGIMNVMLSARAWIPPPMSKTSDGADSSAPTHHVSSPSSSSSYPNYQHSNVNANKTLPARLCANTTPKGRSEYADPIDCV
ncbi:hypothetical protein ONZ45_g7174 [Pleurotus djamor]|nr:hypothetical protein ONZ45_g7174 [Pleurotus djamor]